MAWYNTDNLELLYAPHKRDWRAEAFKNQKVAIDVAKRSAVFARPAVDFCWMSVWAVTKSARHILQRIPRWCFFYL